MGFFLVFSAKDFIDLSGSLEYLTLSLEFHGSYPNYTFDYQNASIQSQLAPITMSRPGLIFTLTLFKVLTDLLFLKKSYWPTPQVINSW